MIHIKVCHRTGEHTLCHTPTTTKILDAALSLRTVMASPLALLATVPDICGQCLGRVKQRPSTSLERWQILNDKGDTLPDVRRTKRSRTITDVMA